MAVRALPFELRAVKTLLAALVDGCGTDFFTPFFIRGAGAGYGEYWLVHLSHPPAYCVKCAVACTFNAVGGDATPRNRRRDRKS
jgi:hypothetical protein